MGMFSRFPEGIEVGVSAFVPDWAIRLNPQGYQNQHSIKKVFVGGDGYLYTASGNGYIHKLSEQGQVIWEAVVRGEYPKALEVAVDTAGNVYAGCEDGLVKISSQGEVLWHYQLEGFNFGSVSKILMSAQGDIYCGSNNGIWKVSPQGEAIWALAEIEGERIIVGQMFLDAGGNVFFADFGTLWKLSEEGNPLWQATISEIGMGSGITIAQGDEGSVYMGGGDAKVHKLSATGEELWVFSGHTEHITSLLSDGAGGVYSGSYDGTIRKLSPQGEELWCYCAASAVNNPIALDARGFIHYTDELGSHKLNKAGKLSYNYPDNYDFIAFGRDGTIYCMMFGNILSALRQSIGAVHSFTEKVALPLPIHGMEPLAYRAEMKPYFETNIYSTNSLYKDANGYFYTWGSMGGFYKLSPQGEILWKYKHDYSNYAVVIASGGIVYQKVGKDLLKFTPEGKELWKMSIGSGYSSFLAVDRDGYIYTCGKDATKSSSFLAKYSGDGTEIWRTECGNLSSIRADATGNIYAFYNSSSLEKFGPDGGKLWSVAINANNALQLKLDAQGNIYTGHRGGILKKWSPQGEELWSISAHTGDVGAVLPDKKGCIYSCGTGNLFCKWNSDGEKIWEKELPHALRWTLKNSGENVYCMCGILDIEVIYKVSAAGEELWNCVPLSPTAIYVDGTRDIYYLNGYGINHIKEVVAKATIYC